MALLLIGLTLGSWGMAAETAESFKRTRFVMLPMDDRPATGQFTQMIGRIAGIDVVLPPQELLGHFTQPGNTNALLKWLKENTNAETDALLVSTDMLAYGGLIASRVDSTPYEVALRRLREFQRWRRQHPKLRVYGFSSIMRIAPTATRANAPWRAHLARFAEVMARFRANPSSELKSSLDNLRAMIPPAEIARYQNARSRSFRIQQELIRMTRGGVFNSMLFGQDDAAITGPHVVEVARLRNQVNNLKLTRHIHFCQGADQLGNLVLSRAALIAADFSPRVRIVWADEQGKTKVAPYEAWTMERSVESQLFASNATVTRGDEWEYSLYVNTPDPRTITFRSFLNRLQQEVDQGFPVAVADGNLGKNGSGDPALFNGLIENGRAARLLGYAAWNTAGNTIGTVIPTANIYLLSRRERMDDKMRELNHRAFLLHRLVNDFQYHRFTRPQAYAMIDANPRAAREETYGQDFDPIDQFVRQDLQRRLDETFRDQFMGRRIFAGTRQYVMQDLTDVDIELPWPRAYEVKIDFRIEATEVAAP